MKKRKEELYTEPWEQDRYETGSTRPPKDRGGIIAVLLMMVIVLGSISTALGIMNIRLFQMLSDQQAGKVYLSKDENESSACLETEESTQYQDITACLGVDGQTVSRFDRRFYHLPQGYLVMEVEEDGFAQQAGVRTGDVIVSIDGKPIQSDADLNAALQELSDGQQVDLQIYRHQLEQQICVTIEVGSEE